MIEEIDQPAKRRISTPPARPGGDAGWGERGLMILLLAALLLATRLPLVLPARSAPLRGFDELDLTYIAADRFLGVSNDQQAWPGGAQQMLLLPILVADFVIGSHGHVGPAAFAQYLDHLYRAPWHALFLAKMLVAVVTSLALAALYVPFRRVLRNRWAAAIAVLTFGCLPVVWSEAATAGSNGQGFAWLVLAVALVLDESALPIAAVAGFCAGIAVGCRTTLVPAMPFALALVLSWRRRRWAAGGLFCLLFIAGYLAVCPYIWDSPIIFAKATLGNFAKHGNAVGLAFGWHAFVGAVPYWLVMALVVSLVVAVVQRRWILLAGTLISMAMLAPSIRSSKVLPYYFMAMPIVAFAFGMVTTGAALTRWMQEQSIAIRRGVGALLLLGALATIAFAAVGEAAGSRAESASLEPRVQAEAALLKMARPGDTVYVPFYFVYTDLASTSSSKACREMAADCEKAAIGGKSAAAFAKSYGFSPEMAYVFADDFVQKERILAARERMMAGITDQPGLNLFFYVAADSEGRLGRPDSNGAIEAFRAGRVDVLLLEDQPIPGLAPTAAFGDAGQHYYLYTQQRRD